MKKIYTVLLIVAIFSATNTHADEELKQAIKARQGLMKNYLWNAKPLFGMAKGKIPYDAKKAQIHADNLELISKMNNGSLWPKGSDNQAFPEDTRALKKIWDTFPAIGEKGKAFKKATADLAAVAGDGKDALKSKIGALGQSCKGCHDGYRADKK